MTGVHGDAGWRKHRGEGASLYGDRPMADWTHLERDAAGHFATSIREGQVRARRRSFWSWYKQRRADLDAIIRARIAPDDTIPETEDSTDLIRVMAYHLQAVHGPENLLPALDEWCRQMAPWARYGLSDTILYVMHDVEGRRTDLSAWRAGFDLRVTWDERVRLGIRTLRPFDLSSDEFKARVAEHKREKDRQRDLARRRAAGAPDRSSWLEENSASRDQPWIAMGISRRTYYRRLKSEREAVLDRGTGPSRLGEAYTTAEGPVPAAEASADDRRQEERDGRAILGPAPESSSLRGGDDPRLLMTRAPLRLGTAPDDARAPMWIAMNEGQLRRNAA